MKKILFFVAATGWMLGLTVHLLSLSGVDVMEKVPFVWLLHLGIFAIWVPTILSLKKKKELRGNQDSSPFNALSNFLENTPHWLNAIAVVGFVYAFINFALFFFSIEGSTAIKDGEYILHNHGHLIKKLTEQEYHSYRAQELRGFSGHWLAFYGFAVAALYPFAKKKRSEILDQASPKT